MGPAPVENGQISPGMMDLLAYSEGLLWNNINYYFKNSVYCTVFSKQETSIPFPTSAKSQCAQCYSGHKRQILPDQPTGSMAAEPVTDAHLCCVKSTKLTHTDSSNCSSVSSQWVYVCVRAQFGIRIQGFFVVVNPCGDFLLICHKNTCTCLFGS